MLKFASNLIVMFKKLFLVEASFTSKFDDKLFHTYRIVRARNIAKAEGAVKKLWRDIYDNPSKQDAFRSTLINVTAHGIIN